MSELESDSIFLDYQAGWPVDHRFLKHALTQLGSFVGNPNSSHQFGLEMMEILDAARSRVATAFQRQLNEVVFTSGATESNFIALMGAAQYLLRRGKRVRVLSSPLEHASVNTVLAQIEANGGEISLLEPDPAGQIDLAQVEDELRNGVDIISLMLANNEIGTVYPLQAVAELARQHNAILHCDASQGLHYLLSEVVEAGIGLISVSGHKIGGLPGSGALIVGSENREKVEPLMVGGGQEYGLRGGTQNSLGAAVLGHAVEACSEPSPSTCQRVRAMQKQLHHALTGDETGGVLIGPPVEQRLLGNLMLSFEGLQGEMIIANCPKLAMSTGSACSSGVPGVSHVLQALPLNQSVREGALRIGLGPLTTDEQVEKAAEIISRAISAARRLLAEPELV